MSKSLFITEKPSVATDFAKALNIKGIKKNGFIESENAIITWCVGHLVTMSYPEKYDKSLKKWSLKDLPFIPKKFKYQVIPQVKNQFDVIKGLMKDPNIDTVYVCTDSAREGEYIYRLVDEMIGVKGKEKKRVWIDSQTIDEIKRGVKEAKPLYCYDKLADSAYLRAKEDYLIGINFSRLLSLIYGNTISSYTGTNYTSIAVGRVMTCVLGMIVIREREIREFIKVPYFRISALFNFKDSLDYDGEWKAVEGSKYHLSRLLFKDIGFREKSDAEKFISELRNDSNEVKGVIEKIEKKTEKKNPPLLYNLAELQNDCSKIFKISPDETLKVVQSLYEKKMLTYPRTDARVLTKAVAKEIDKNIKPFLNINSLLVLDEGDKEIESFVKNIVNNNLQRGLEKTKYVNDSRVSDHYAIIPTGDGLSTFNQLGNLEKEIFILVLRRFLAIFYPQAIYNKLTITTKLNNEKFFTNRRVCTSRGYLEIIEKNKNKSDKAEDIETLKQLKKGQTVDIKNFEIKESETTPPKRYNSGSMILAMENAGKLIEDEELREQIKSNGIGTSATRAEILNKLTKIKYTKLNKKTQIISPTPMGEMIYDVVNNSIPSLLKPELTASWEKGLEMVANGDIDSDEYMFKLENYINKNANTVMNLKNNSKLTSLFSKIPKNDKANSINTKTAKKIKNSLGKCTVCKNGDILENKKAYFCTNWREGCKFTIWKNALENLNLEVTPDMMKELLKNKKLENVFITNPGSRQKIKATLQLENCNIKVI